MRLARHVVAVITASIARDTPTDDTHATHTTHNTRMAHDTIRASGE